MASDLAAVRASAGGSGEGGVAEGGSDPEAAGAEICGDDPVLTVGRTPGSGGTGGAPGGGRSGGTGGAEAGSGGAQGDGASYDNPCRAAMAGVSAASTGDCPT
ncbi:MAG TPA: hypothetical protein PLU22_12610 [Polyangiaceae bacterium]|nr:hypothetical protein [Polyangiaceae bacterium]